MKTTGLDTVQPEDGKRYRMRNGAITGYMIEDKNLAALGISDRFRTEEKIDGFAQMWRSNGLSTFVCELGDSNDLFPLTFVIDGKSIYDLVEEVE